MSLTITVSEDAAQRLGLIVTQQREHEQQGLRIFARSGGCGCSGPAFAMGIDAPSEDDSILDLEGVRFIVDPQTATSPRGRLDRLHRGRPDAQGLHHRRPQRAARRRRRLWVRRRRGH